MRNILLAALLLYTPLLTDTGPYLTHISTVRQDDAPRQLSPEDQNRLLSDVMYFRQQIENNRSEPANYFNLGLAAVALDKLATAEAAFMVVTELRPGDADAHFNLGMVYARQDRYDEAIEAFGRVVEMDPERAEPHYNLGQAYQISGMLVESVKSFVQATTLDPDNSLCH